MVGPFNKSSIQVGRPLAAGKAAVSDDEFIALATGKLRSSFAAAARTFEAAQVKVAS